jgi:glycosyltransferase involved in cell wall biosynthesis
VELSIVMPCLNEADTLETCILKAQRAIRENGIVAEVIVADNGSDDGSPEIARRNGARVIPVKERGYGSALMAGIAAARGRYVIMADADDSYDFLETPRFLAKLREGFDIVQGCRLPSGGGRILPGAMPRSHRWLGNPVLSRLVRKMFYAPIHDVYCGMRGFTKAFYDRLDLRCTGMEFATEMIIKASLYRQKFTEVPITLHPDGRISHPPHLRTLRDGWRTLRFFLIYSPKWLYFLPGAALGLLGVAGYAIALPGLTVDGVNVDVHSLLVASLAVLMGYQTMLFAIFAKTFAISERLVPPDPRLDRLFRVVNLERGLFLGLAVFVVGLSLISMMAWRWWQTGLGGLDYPTTMRWVIPGVTLAALGFQTILSAFFVSILGLRRR